MPEVLERCVKHVMDSGKPESSAWPICIDRLRKKHPSVEKWLHRKKKKSALMNCLTIIASQLDQKGLYEEATKIDDMIKNAGTWAIPKTIEQVDKLDMYLKLLSENRVDLHCPECVLKETLGDDNLFDDLVDIKEDTFESIVDAILSTLEGFIDTYEARPATDEPTTLPVEALKTLVVKYSK